MKFNTIKFRPMLAKAGKKVELHEGDLVQPKLDGVRCVAMKGVNGDIQLMSRTGKEFRGLKHIKNELKNSISNEILDGELYVHGARFEQIVSLAKNTSKNQTELEFHIFDVYLDNQSYMINGDRQMYIETLNVSPPVFIVDTIRCTTESLDQIKKLHLKQGYEGSIVRRGELTYMQGKRSLIKIKPMKDAEFVIKGYTCGTGKDKGAVVWQCETKDGKSFNVRPKGSLKERKKLFKHGRSYIGKLLTVQYQELTVNGIPRFPVGFPIGFPVGFPVGSCIGLCIRDYE